MWVFLRDSVLDTDEICKGDEKDRIFPKFQWHIHIYTLKTALKVWPPDPALLAEERNKQRTDPMSSHSALGAALRFLLLSALRLWL